jgi:hypothetical protein
MNKNVHQVFVFPVLLFVERENKKFSKTTTNTRKRRRDGKSSSPRRG